MQEITHACITLHNLCPMLKDNDTNEGEEIVLETWNFEGLNKKAVET